MYALIFISRLLGPGTEFGRRPGFGIFPRAEGFSDWCLSWGSSCVCMWCFSEAMNQQFNYALFRKFSHHIAPGKVFPLFHLYVSKNAWTLKWFLPNLLFQSHPPFSLFPSKWKHPSSLFGCIPLRAIEIGHMGVTLQTGLGLWFSVGLEPDDLVLTVQKNSIFSCEYLEKEKKIDVVSSYSKHIVRTEKGEEGKGKRACTFFPVLAASIIFCFAFLPHSPTIFIFWSRLRRPWALLGLLLSCLPFPLPRGK